MEKQFVVNQSVNFSDQRAYVKPGDILTYHVASKDLVVFRDGMLVCTLKSVSVAGMEQMTARGWFSPIVKEVEQVPAAPEPEVSSEPDVPQSEPSSAVEESEVPSEQLPPKRKSTRKTK